MLVQAKQILVILLCLTVVKSSKILAIFPSPGPSQFIYAKTYLETLATRGHELTVISHFPQKQNLANYTDIKLEYPNYHENFINKISKATVDAETMQVVVDFFKNVTLNTLENNEVQALLKSTKAHFDLVIIETALTEALYAIGPHFKAPLIGASTCGTDPTVDILVGNISPMAHIPLVTATFTDSMNFWQRLENMQLIVSNWWHMQRYHLPAQTQIFEKYFPQLNMKLEEVIKNFSLILANQHFSVRFPRPYVPAMVEVGGMHINYKPAALPKDIADFINDAEAGVIYFSMGTNVLVKDFPAVKLQILLKVFGSLKQRVLWKCELEELPGKPENVFISKWFPQSDILAHPNVKLLITHGGFFSIIETIHHAKPLVGLPTFYDQFANMARAELAGYGVAVNFNSFKESELRSAIEEVLNNQSYTRAAKEISTRYHDHPMKPLDNAIYWTEYVLRHNGARHMRIAAQDLNFIAYHNIDIFGYLFVKWFILPSVLIIIISKLISRCLKNK